MSRTPPCWLLASVGLAVAAASGIRLVWGDGEPLLAWRGGEVWGHLWTWWWHGEALPRWPGGTELAVNTASWPLVDRVPAAMGALISRLLGVVTAWNLLVMLSILGAFLGGAFAARRAGGSPWVGGVVLALGPVFTGSLASGLSEDMSVGLLAAVAALALHPHGARWSLSLGLGLGALAWCGLYLAWMGGLVVAGAALAGLLAPGRPRGPALGRWMVALSLGALVALPPLLEHAPRGWAGHGHRHGTVAEGVEPLWKLNPWKSADVLSFVSPGRAPPPADAVVRLHPVYLGFLPLLLVGLGGRSRWCVVLGVAALAALGPEVRVGGVSTGVENPVVKLIQLVPGGAQVNHHARLFLVGQVALAVLAARGATRLRKLPWLAPVLAALVALEYALLAPTPWPLPVADAAPHPMAARLTALDPGGVLWLPASGPGVNPQRPLLDQRVHRRPLALDPNRPGVPGHLAREAPWIRSAIPSGPGPEPPCHLVEAGFPILVATDSMAAWLEGSWPPPPVTGEGSAWDLRSLCSPEGQGLDMVEEEQTP